MTVLVDELLLSWHIECVIVLVNELLFSWHIECIIVWYMNYCSIGMLECRFEASPALNESKSK